jgi:hypothetical protein
VVRTSGAAPPTDCAVSGSQKAAFREYSPSSRKHLSVYSGRQPLGTIDVINGVFTTYDASGALVGRFRTLREAVDALDDGGAP